MITEIAILPVKPDMREAFEKDFAQASQYISAIPGYVSHSLIRCIEQPNQYLLRVLWEKLEDHTIGFRQSTEYLEWKRLLHHYYEPFPVVEHYETVYEQYKK